MRSSTLICAVVLGAMVIATIVPQSSSLHMSNRNKMMLAKKIGALLLLHRKKYLFAVPFPLPIPLPLLKKTQPIIYKERVPVAVPYHEPIPVHEPWPVPVHEPYPSHEPWASASVHAPVHHQGPHHYPQHHQGHQPW